MKKFLVFCAASNGTDASFTKAAKELGEAIATRGTLVYGGAQVGLMGVVANAALEKKGKVIGVLPKFLSRKEVAHQGLSELLIVESMHERKAKMLELSEAIIALPGGFGTFEELFEALTWAQLGLHQKPIGILNISGYYDALLQQLDHMVQCGLLKAKHRNLVLSDNTVEGLLHQINHYQAVPETKWLENKSQT